MPLLLGALALLWCAGCVHRQGFVELPITLSHARRAGGLRIEHRDPFDRMLIAEAQMEDLPLVTNEALFDGPGITRVWQACRL